MIVLWLISSCFDIALMVSWATASKLVWIADGSWTCASRPSDMRTAKFDAQCLAQLQEHGDHCSVTLVESIPQGIYVNGTGTLPTYQGLFICPLLYITYSDIGFIMVVKSCLLKNV